LELFESGNGQGLDLGGVFRLESSESLTGLGLVLGGVFREGTVPGLILGFTLGFPFVSGNHFNVLVPVGDTADVETICIEGPVSGFLIVLTHC
jgi:hypothetical protein